MKKPTCPLLALLAAVPAIPLTATANTYNWTGTTSGAWNTTVPTNWNGTTPVFDNAADVVFSDTPAIVTPLTFLGDGPRTVRSISVTGAPAAALEIRTNQNNATGRILHFSSSTGTANLNIAATVAQTLNIGQGTGANNVGNVNLVSDLAIDHQGTGLVTISRPVNESVAGRSISKSGAGTLLLSQANTYTGSTIINGGIVRLGNAAGLGATSGDTFVQSGGTLDLNGQLLAAGETITIAGAGAGGIGALYSSAGNSGLANHIADNLILAGNASIGVPSGVRVGIGGNGTSTTSGLFTLTKVGAGQFDLRGLVTIGDVVVNQGALQIEAGTTYNNNGYTVTVNSGAFFRSFELVNPFTRNFILNGGNIATAGTLPAGNLYTGNVSLTGSNGIETGGGEGDLMIFSGNFTETAPGASLTTTGLHRTVLSGTNTYTGPTTVNSGFFQAAGTFTSDFSVAPFATLDGEGSTTGTVTLASDAIVQFDPSTTGADQFLRAADFIIPSDATIPIAAKVAAPGSNIVVLRDGNGGLDLNRFQLQNPGRASLTLGGAGGNSDLLYNFPAAQLEWRAFSNSDWGTEDAWQNFQNLGTNQPDDFFSRDNVDFTDVATGAVTILSPVTAGNVVFKNTTGHDIAIGTLGSGSLDATSLSTTATTTGNVSLDLPLTGTSPITLNGTGIVALTGSNNSSTGTITVNAGTLQIGNGGNTTTLTAPVVNNAAVVVNRADTLTLAQPFSGTGTFTQVSAGTVILSGENTTTGLTKVDAGILQVGAGGTGSVAGPIETNASLDFNRTGLVTHAGNITGSGLVNKRNTNTLTLTGTNTFAGGLNLFNGVVIAGDANLGTGPITLGPSGTNQNTLSLAGTTVDNEIFFNNTGTGLKIINLAAGFTDAILSGTIHLDAATLTGSGVSRISPATGTIVISGKMTGAGAAGYSKRNIGTVVITNPTNDYTGPTSIVDSGFLIVDGRVPGNVFFGEGFGAGTGNILGTLGGSGSIGGNVELEINSKISPGCASAAGLNTDTRATLTIDGNLDASAIGSGSGRIVMQLGASTATSDRIQIGGTLNLGSDLIGLGEFIITNGGGLTAGTYTLIHATGGITGTLDQFNLTGEIAPGYAGELSIVGNDVVLTVTGSGSPYDAWAATFPGLTDTSFEVDFDGDGLATGLEWILGGDPTLNDSASITPTLTGDATTGITLSFDRIEESIGFASLSVEYGTTLTTWPGSVFIESTSTGPDANGVTVSVNDVPTPHNITVTIPASNAANGKLFARLKATNP